MKAKETKGGRIGILLLLCLLAMAANTALSQAVQSRLHLPLFLDTLFNAAITFSAGLLPGIATAILPFGFFALRQQPPEPNFFVFCSIAEVFLIWIFHRRLKKSWPSSRTRSRTGSRAPSPAAEPAPYSFIVAASSLLILALMDCAMISILGGAIDTTIFMLFSQTKIHFSPEGVFRLGLLRNGVPILWANILARFPINLVDRFIVVFGGYGVSLLIGKIYPERPASPAF